MPTTDWKLPTKVVDTDTGQLGPADPDRTQKIHEKSAQEIQHYDSTFGVTIAEMTNSDTMYADRIFSGISISSGEFQVNDNFTLSGGGGAFTLLIIDGAIFKVCEHTAPSGYTGSIVNVSRPGVAAFTSTDDIL